MLTFALIGQTPPGRIDPPEELRAVSKVSDALVLQPEELITGPYVHSIALSPGGGHAVITRSNQAAAKAGQWQSANTILILDVSRRTLKEVAKYEAGVVEDFKLAWAGNNRAYALVSREVKTPPAVHHDLYAIEAAAGTWRQIATTRNDDLGPYAQLHVSPQGQVVVFGQRVEFGQNDEIVNEQFVFRVLDGEKLSEPYLFPRETSGPKSAAWSADGRTLELRVERGDFARRAIRQEVAQFHLAERTLTFEPYSPEFDDAEPPDFSLKVRDHELEANRWTHGVATLWLEASLPSDDPSAFVCAEPGAFALSPTLNYILYTTKGSLWIRPLQKMRLPEIREKQILAIRDRAVLQGQKMGRAVTLYWRDNGRTYPPKATFRQEIRAYNEDDEAIARFVATFEGGPVPFGVNTSTTPVGYIDAGIGRAHVMMDGGVRWEYLPRG